MSGKLLAMFLKYINRKLFLGIPSLRQQYFCMQATKIGVKKRMLIQRCFIFNNFLLSLGLLSTYFPNRTASNWGRCCSKYEYRMMKDILNHNKTLLFLINQHSNFSHPKLLTIPRYYIRILLFHLNIM